MHSIFNFSSSSKVRLLNPLGISVRQYSAAQSLNSGCSAKIINGRAEALGLRDKIKKQVSLLKEQFGEKAIPGLAILTVSNQKDSLLYTKNKIKASQEVGMNIEVHSLKPTVSQAEAEQLIQDLNIREDIHGIILQLPLPASSSLSVEPLLTCIDASKDVDGFNPIHMGHLALLGKEPEFVPCTAMACVELIKSLQKDITGKRAVILGRSNIVGLPTALALNKLDCTVTMCHDLSRNTREIAREADILISAAGSPELVRWNWVKEGAMVIDVGINFVRDHHTQKLKLVGDVAFEEVKEVAEYITPVPGGVGPMTVTMLLFNTLNSASKKLGLQPISCDKVGLL